MKKPALFLLAAILSFNVSAAEREKRGCIQWLIDAAQRFDLYLAEIDTGLWMHEPKEREEALKKLKALREADKRNAYGSNANQSGNHGDTSYGAGGHGDLHGGGGHGDMHGGGSHGDIGYGGNGQGSGGGNGMGGGFGGGGEGAGGGNGAGG